MGVYSVFVILIILAAGSDIITRKIPNPLNFTLLVSGVVASLAGWLESITWSESLFGVLASFAVLLLPFALRIYQGGDVKLCMGMGAWLGVKGALWTIGLGVVGGGILGLCIKIKAQTKSRQELTVPMAVSFALSGYIVCFFGAPPW